jgi:SAM-dependent methyltransferase
MNTTTTTTTNNNLTPSHRATRSSERLPPRPGWYERRLFPRILDAVMDTAETRRIRAQVCAPLSGDVVEIGFGTGHNLAHLPSAVTRIRAVDPMVAGRRLAAERIAATDVAVDFIGLDGQRIELPDRSTDSVLCTWTLCSIEDPVAAVREIARILRPGGELHFVEHGLSPDEKIRRRQHRWNRLHRRIACGCNVDRDIPRLLEQGGMTIEAADTFYAKGDPKYLGWTVQGRATVRRDATAEEPRGDARVNSR